MTRFELTFSVKIAALSLTLSKSKITLYFTHQAIRSLLSLLNLLCSSILSLCHLTHIRKKNTQPSQALKLAKDKSTFISRTFFFFFNFFYRFSRSFELVSFIKKYINFSLEYFLGIQIARIQNSPKRKKKNPHKTHLI